MRPDIFLRTGLHNLNTKLRDNAVYLNWITTYKDYRGSLLFRVADRLLAAQQDFPAVSVGEAWDYYFPFQARTKKEQDEGITSFLAFLRFSYYRPRDINSMIGTIQDFIIKNRGSADYVSGDDFDDPSFRDAHAEYLLGEIRDQLLFYYSQDEYNLFLQFFLHLRGQRKFSYSQYLDAFSEFIVECARARKELPQFFKSADAFLQFLYEQNVISYIEQDAEGENERFVRWCFRERTLSNMAPKVRIGVHYEIFYGLSKALNVGRTVKVHQQQTRRLVGTITSVNSERGFGFLRGGAQQDDYYFKLSEYRDPFNRPPRVSQKVTFEIQVKYGKPRAIVVASAN